MSPEPLQKPKPRVLTKLDKALASKRQLQKATTLVRKRDGGNCRACGKPGMQAHHIVYRSHGGKHEVSNLVWVCGQCHRFIHAHVLLVAFNPKRPAATIRFERNHEWDRASQTHD